MGGEHSGGARVIFEPRKGYGSAYLAGLPAATGDIIATVDGDGTYPSTAITPLIDELLAGRQIGAVPAGAANRSAGSSATSRGSRARASAAARGRARPAAAPSRQRPHRRVRPRIPAG